ncbi:MAG: hypothetical protein ACR2QE_19300 [Acidimicrobiales bacterium]
MSEDTPITPDDGDIGALADMPAKAWYQKPATWIIVALALLAVVIAAVIASNNDDDETAGTDSATTTVAAPTTSSTPGETTTSAPAETTTSAPGETTTSAPAETTTTAAPETTTVAPGPETVAIEASSVNASVNRYAGTDDDFPFVDGDVEAHWYTWDGFYVVVYGGWDATAGDPFCPGNSLNMGGSFDFISNSPTFDGSCDPEDRFPNLVDDDTTGARVCDTLVLYRTIIPVEDDAGDPITGQLYGTIERVSGDGFVGATGVAEISAVAELDPEADAYSVPEGWLPGGATEVTC